MIRAKNYLLLFMLALLAGLLIICTAGCGSDDNNADPGRPGDNGSKDNGDKDDDKNNDDIKQVDGKDPKLPLFPGSIRVFYFEPNDNSRIVSYIAPAPMDEVFKYYQQQFAGNQGVAYFKGAYGEGEHTFETPLAGADEEAFILTLDYYEDDKNKTAIEIVATPGYFD